MGRRIANTNSRKSSDIKDEIDKVSREVQSMEEERAKGKPAVSTTSLAERRSELSRRQAELSSRERKLAWYAWMRPSVTAWTPGTPIATLAMLMGLMIVGIALKGLFDFLQEYLATGVVQLAVFDLRNEFFRKTLNLDLTHFSEHGTHDLMARGTNDLETLYNGMKALYGKVMMEPLKVVSCLTFAWMFNWRLTLLAIVLFGVAPIVIGSVGRYLKRMSRKNLESVGAIYKILHESFLGIRVVKAFAMERYERSRLFRENKRYYHQAMKLNRTEAMSSPILEFLAVTAIALAILAGSYLVLTGNKTVWGVRLDRRPDRPKHAADLLRADRRDVRSAAEDAQRLRPGAARRGGGGPRLPRRRPRKPRAAEVRRRRADAA